MTRHAIVWLRSGGVECIAIVVREAALPAVLHRRGRKESAVDVFGVRHGDLAVGRALAPASVSTANTRRFHVHCGDRDCSVYRPAVRHAWGLDEGKLRTWLTRRAGHSCRRIGCRCDECRPPTEVDRGRTTSRFSNRLHRRSSDSSPERRRSECRCHAAFRSTWDGKPCWILRGTSKRNRAPESTCCIGGCHGDFDVDHSSSHL